jgi:hypothetical protein
MQAKPVSKNCASSTHSNDTTVHRIAVALGAFVCTWHAHTNVVVYSSSRCFHRSESRWCLNFAVDRFLTRPAIARFNGHPHPRQSTTHTLVCTQENDVDEDARHECT